MAVNPIITSHAASVAPAGPTPAAPGPTSAGGGSRSAQEVPFADLVNDLIRDTSSQQGAVDESLKQLVTGETDSIHDVVLAASRADLAFRLVMEIRNRLISSYQEIMRMQV